MSEKSGETTKGVAENPEHLHGDLKIEKPIPTSWGYRGFVLVSCAFVLFELIFVSLYSTTSWFGTDIRYLGIPVVLLLLPVAHHDSSFLQQEIACPGGLPCAQRIAACYLLELAHAR